MAGAPRASCGRELTFHGCFCARLILRSFVRFNQWFKLQSSPELLWHRAITPPFQIKSQHFCSFFFPCPCKSFIFISWTWFFISVLPYPLTYIHKQELKKVEAKIIWYNYIIIFASAVKVHRNKWNHGNKNNEFMNFNKWIITNINTFNQKWIGCHCRKKNRREDFKLLTTFIYFFIYSSAPLSLYLFKILVLSDFLLYWSRCVFLFLLVV